MRGVKIQLKTRYLGGGWNGFRGKQEARENTDDEGQEDQ